VVREKLASKPEVYVDRGQSKAVATIDAARSGARARQLA